ncbi:MAG: acyltransferase [Tardiphaga sp.]|nr:acyltransferase [Tardiphaga sp.]
MKYRPDIDGLRALAVIPVVMFHLRMPGVSGGYLGVDVFFVISGHLICGLIDREIRAGHFSIGNFYRRRALRILPALIAMLLATTLLAYLYSLPVELTEYSSSLASAVGSVSNFYFAATAGYFDAPAETKPLLHTWSLSVEEQFYVLMPLFMLLAWRFFPKRMRAVFAAAMALSLLAALAMSLRNATFAFYLTPFRAWELGFGALLSMHILPAPRNIVWRELCGIAGLLLLLALLVFGSSAYPLLAMTSLACAGAVLVIASSEHGPSLVGRWLSWPPIVMIGLISYSLYLWHWPAIVFQRTDAAFFPEASDVVTRLILLIGLIGIAYLSWRFIERPFRSSEAPTRRVLVASAAAMASVFAIGAALIAGGGAPYRFPDRVVSIAAYLGYDPTAAFRTGQCYLGANRQQFDAETCLRLDPARPNYLLVGDSHAAHLWLGLSSAMPEINVLQATASTCRPAIPAADSLDSRACPRLMHYVFGQFLHDHKVDRILLAASWKDEDIPQLAHTLDTLKSMGLDVVVLGPIVEYDGALPRLLANQIMRDRPTMKDRRTIGIRERDLAMRQMVTAHGVSYISVYDAVCPTSSCDTSAAAGVPMQFDAGHLTAQGSIEVGRRLIPALRAATQPPRAIGLLKTAG